MHTVIAKLIKALTRAGTDDAEKAIIAIINPPIRHNGHIKDATDSNMIGSRKLMPMHILFYRQLAILPNKCINVTALIQNKDFT